MYSVVTDICQYNVSIHTSFPFVHFLLRPLHKFILFFLYYLLDFELWIVYSAVNGFIGSMYRPSTIHAFV